MPTKTKTRKPTGGAGKRATTPVITEPEAVRAMAFPQSAFLSLGHDVCPPEIPDFGEPMFAPEAQAAHPDQPMTRLVKDVARTGRWLVGYAVDEATGGQTERWWDVDEERLRKIFRCNKLAQSRGFAVNLVKTHGDPFTGVVHPNDIICPIHDWRVHDGSLWVAVYVTPEQAKTLLNPAWKVSVYCEPNYTDGAGNVYEELCLHVAVVDLPVVDSQGPFVKCAIPRKPKGGGKSMDTAALIENLNALLEVLGHNPLPEDTTEENLIDRLIMLVSMLGGEATEDDEATEESAGSATDGESLTEAFEDGGAGVAASQTAGLAAFKALLAPMAAQMATLAGDVKSILTERQAGVRQAGEGILASAAGRGVDPAVVEGFRKAWKAAGYQAVILKPLEGIAASIPHGRSTAARTVIGGKGAAAAAKGAASAKGKRIMRAMGGNPDRVPAHLKSIVFEEDADA